MMLTHLDLMGREIPHVGGLKELQMDASVLGEEADGVQMKINSGKGEIIHVNKAPNQLSGLAFHFVLFCFEL